MLVKTYYTVAFKYVQHIKNVQCIIIPQQSLVKTKTKHFIFQDKHMGKIILGLGYQGH